MKRIYLKTYIKTKLYMNLTSEKRSMYKNKPKHLIYQTHIKNHRNAEITLKIKTKNLHNKK